MAVYTHLSAETLAALIAEYDVGELQSAKGIAEGVSNSNWLVETTRDRFILTMYEERVDTRHLPFYLGLLDHLAAKGAPVPRTIHDRDGNLFRTVEGKAVALIEFLPGVSVGAPTVAQAASVGRSLAEIHLAVADFPQRSEQTMGLAKWDQLIHQCGEEALAEIDPSLADTVFSELSWLAGNWPGGLPHGVVHCDLFPDNVLMLGDKVTGLIDFYFAATDFFAYDLAVTHAAWCFADHGRTFRPRISSALLEGYEAVRPLDRHERAELPVLSRGACMRFISSRAYDWLNTPVGALVTRKDPMDFVRRLEFYRSEATRVFNSDAD
ncbi:homoserine kinase [Altererythrobacter salegens]|uniref:Homoserine kinase n=1 Tax=Croceibacterium salegens TaxID=1737568 RepID=A0A6I4SQI4_9SPHN|nr:homoserine kinase [Croceibacterium salegens]MXO58075.1 homoserine kinase [Croceibacterium salegens]